MDETLIGGKNRNRHRDKKVPYSQGRSYIDKIPVWGAIERESGNLIAQAVPNTTQETLEAVIRANVEEAEKYVEGKASTNRIESAWATPKRSVYGIYHKVSPKHLPRNYEDEERFDLVLASTVGKRLTYESLIHG
ncbi:39212_t:CDS:2 [Gigaspora margarita]|uniref:39212_t:CDS:1 n=1 Tax=Gigaspora margarita TaxID=4874 RepID=A0ABN7UA33_GIGMA|nr:39212_t:CDS:2 [Gigaspora margarita]